MLYVVSSVNEMLEKQLTKKLLLYFLFLMADFWHNTLWGTDDFKSIYINQLYIQSDG